MDEKVWEARLLSTRVMQCSQFLQLNPRKSALAAQSYSMINFFIQSYESTNKVHSACEKTNAVALNNLNLDLLATYANESLLHINVDQHKQEDKSLRF